MRKRGKTEQEAARSARLSAALRENLKRRKAQVRGRAATRLADDSAETGRGTAPTVPDFRRNRGRE
jgi:hypothetical protein